MNMRVKRIVVIREITLMFWKDFSKVCLKKSGFKFCIDRVMIHMVCGGDENHSRRLYSLIRKCLRVLILL